MKNTDINNSLDNGMIIPLGKINKLSKENKMNIVDTFMSKIIDYVMGIIIVFGTGVVQQFSLKNNRYRSIVHKLRREQTRNNIDRHLSKLKKLYDKYDTLLNIKSNNTFYNKYLANLNFVDHEKSGKSFGEGAYINTASHWNKERCLELDNDIKTLRTKFLFFRIKVF